MKLSPKAFTLVECVLAIGISSIVVVAILGLLPIGLDANRTATLHSSEERIVERIRQQNLVAPAIGEFYFDGLGQLLENTPVDAVFAVRVEETAGVTLPGDDAACLRSLIITISDRAYDNPFGDPRRLHVHQLLLAPPNAEGSPP